MQGEIDIKITSGTSVMPTILYLQASVLYGFSWKSMVTACSQDPQGLQMLSSWKWGLLLRWGGWLLFLNDYEVLRVELPVMWLR